MTADERRRLRRSIWLLVAVFVAVGLLDTAAITDDGQLTLHEAA